MLALYILGLIPLGFVSALLVILIRRKLYTRFPVFFAYSVWTICATALRLAAGKHPVFFFLAYWLTEVSYFIIALVAIAMILHPFAKSLYDRHSWSRFVIPALLLLVIGTSLFAATFKPMDASAIGRFASAVYVFVPLMCLLEVVLVFWAVVLARRHRIGWSRYEAGILAGFGILAFLTLIARLPGSLTLFHLKVGPQLEGLFRYLPSGAFISSAIAWLITFWRPEPPSNYEPPDARKLQELTTLIKERTELLKQVLKAFGLRFDYCRCPP
jgi:hypothetical protein